MISPNAVSLMSDFPDFKIRGFNMGEYNQQFRERNMIICARSKDIYYDKHWGCLSLKFVINGDEYYQTGHSTYGVDCSNFLILNRDTEYSSFIHSPQIVESFTLNFADDFTSSTLASLNSKHEDLLENNTTANMPQLVERLYPRDKNIFPVAAKIYERIGELEERNEEVAELYIDLLLSVLKSNLLVNEEINDIQKAKLSTRQELYKRLNYAKDFIDTCFSEDINLDSISTVACMNREYFIRQFKIHYKLTPNQYLIKKRMEAARRRLLFTEESISKICCEVGYSDLSSFGKLFKRYFKLTPENYRNQAR